MTTVEVKVYKAVHGSTLKDDDAETIGQFLQHRFGDKPRTPEEVVDAARSKRSQIHRYFEWDNSIAGRKWRLHQAAYLLRSIDVVLVNGEERPPTRAFHNVVVSRDDESVRAYVPAAVVWEKADLAQQVREEAIRDLVAVKRRISEYSELSEAAEKIGQIVRELAG